VFGFCCVCGEIMVVVRCGFVSWWWAGGGGGGGAGLVEEE